MRSNNDNHCRSFGKANKVAPHGAIGKVAIAAKASADHVGLKSEEHACHKQEQCQRNPRSGHGGQVQPARQWQQAYDECSK
jgi:hypothetical protein